MHYSIRKIAKTMLESRGKHFLGATEEREEIIRATSSQLSVISQKIYTDAT